LANFTALPRVQGDPGDQELAVGQAADAGLALGDQAVDLGLLAALQGVGLAAAAAGAAGEGLEGDVADPERDAALGDAEAGGDLGQGQPGAAQVACPPPLVELAPVAHGASSRNAATAGAMHPQGRDLARL
jgi:hypothetical protein